MTQFDDWSVLASCLVVFAGDCGLGFMRINDYTPCGKRTVRLFAVGAAQKMNLEGANSGVSPSGVQESRRLFAVERLFRCHLWHLGGHMAPLLPPPLNPPVVCSAAVAASTARLSVV